MVNLWWLPTLISALLLGGYELGKKASVRDNSVMGVLFFSTLSGLIFLLGAAAISGCLSAAWATTPGPWLLVAFKSLLVSASWICGFYALKELPISLAAPIRSTSPLWTLLGGIVFFQEVPSAIQSLGMTAILIGHLSFSLIGKREGFAWRSRGMVLIVICTLLGAGSALYDKFLLHTMQLPRDMMQLHFSIDLTVIFGLLLLIRYAIGNAPAFHWNWVIPATGILLIISDFVYFYALSLPDTPISLVSLVRRCSCIVSFLLGAWIFREHRDFKIKCAALAILLSGVVLLALPK